MHAKHRHLSATITRRVGLAAAAAAALAIAAPVPPASAATPRAVIQTADGWGCATGPTLIGDTFNGPTVIVTSPSSAVGSP